jgi:hypothetical protein
LTELRRRVLKGFFLGFLMLIIFNIFITSFVYAESNTKIISEEKAGGFHYSITAKNHAFTWEVGDKKSESVIEENKDNERELESFRTAVQDIKNRQIELIIYVIYLVIIIIFTRLTYKKVKENKKSIIGIGLLFANYAIYKSFVAFIYLQDALDEAKFYYAVLT